MHGETGPTTLLRLCERSRMNWVCRLLLVSGTPLDFPQMAASRTSSDVGLPKSSMVAFPCSLPWDTLRPTLAAAESCFFSFSTFCDYIYCSLHLFTVEHYNAANRHVLHIYLFTALQA